MQLMISVTTQEEAQKALTGGADILDIKNPAEGSLGAQPPAIIKAIKTLVPPGMGLSAAIGDMPNLPGTAALAALGAATCGADYIKVGLHGTHSEAEAGSLLREVRKAVLDFETSVIAAAYADFHRAGTLNPKCLPRIAASTAVGGFLLDTALKDGRTLFDFLEPSEIRLLAEQAHADGLLFGLAGALGEKDIPLARELGADVIGFRTAACRDNQRDGTVDDSLVRRLRRATRQPPAPWVA